MIRFVSEEHPMAMNVMRIENLPAGPAPEIEAPEASRGTTTESKESKSQSRTPWDLGAVPEVDTGKVRSRRGSRSEEHTSELQSRFDLVCRLLLEKKNII